MEFYVDKAIKIQNRHIIIIRQKVDIAYITHG